MDSTYTSKTFDGGRASGRSGGSTTPRERARRLRSASSAASALASSRAVVVFLTISAQSCWTIFGMPPDHVPLRARPPAP